MTPSSTNLVSAVKVSAILMRDSAVSEMVSDQCVASIYLRCIFQPDQRTADGLHAGKEEPSRKPATSSVHRDRCLRFLDPHGRKQPGQIVTGYVLPFWLGLHRPLQPTYAFFVQTRLRVLMAFAAIISLTGD